MKKDLTGQKFGRLTALKIAGKAKDGRIVWECLCECKNIIEIRGKDLSSGNTKSCGCLQRENRIFHNHANTKKRTKTYTTWQAMINRCTNPNNIGYHNYGGRGIKVCTQWRDFKNFLKDMGEKPKGLTLDREENNGDYTPDNCRWITHQNNIRNCRHTKLTIRRVKRIKQLLRDTNRSCKEIAKLYGLGLSTIYSVKNGVAWEDVEYELGFKPL